MYTRKYQDQSVKVRNSNICQGQSVKLRDYWSLFFNMIYIIYKYLLGNNGEVFIHELVNKIMEWENFHLFQELGGAHPYLRVSLYGKHNSGIKLLLPINL